MADRRRRLGAIAAGLLTLTLAAGALGQTQPPPSQPIAPPPLPSAAALPPPPPIDDPQLAPPPQAPRTLRSWDEALSLVRAQSPDYIATYDAIVRAEAQTRVALAAVLPSAVAQGTFTHQLLTTTGNFGTGPITIPPQDVFAATGTLTWNVLSPRAMYAIGTAKAGVEVAKSDLAEQRRAIAQSIVSSMLATLAAERIAELNRVGLRAALERLALAQAKTKYGSGTALDIDRAQQDVASARSLVINGDESLRQTREALGLALGSPVSVAAPGSLDLEGFERTVASTCRMNDTVERRADVVAARRRVDVAERGIEDVWLQFAPSLALQSQLAWGSQVLFGPTTTWNLAAVVTVPIWDGGARYGYLRDARAAADQAAQNLAKLRLDALVEVARSTRAVEVTRASRDVAQEQRDLAQRIDQRTREGYLHGLGTSLDLVVSAQALRNAEINLALLQFQAAQARVLAILANAECAY